MKDRVIQGMIAGIGGWVPQIITTFAMFAFHITKLRFLDFAGILAFGHRPHGLLESIFSESIVIAQVMVYGALFSLVIQIISSRGMLLKGGLFGWFCWYSTYILADLYKTKGIHGTVNFSTAAVNFTASVVWGIGMAWTFQLINRKFNVNKLTAKGSRK